ncbi:MAG: YdcF family protein [Bacteroidota bacterium]|nr:YdcF family protein [Bacteroidota bacterium]
MSLSLREKFIALVDNDGLLVSDAIVLLEGDGFNRYIKAADLYKNGYSKKIIFSGAITDYNYGSFPFKDILPKLLSSGVPEEAIIHEKKSKNTREQAVEVIDIAVKNNWRKIILVATHDHQYRAYLTFLKEVLSRKKEILLFNSPVRNLKWFEQNVWGRRFDNIDKEFDKIDHYMEMGHLASYEEAIEYQEVKEIQLQ